MLPLCLLVALTFAQTPEERLNAKIADVRYPPLAKSVRVQGDVRLKLRSGVVSPISGHPLLVPTAVQNAKDVGLIQSESALEMTYHFLLNVEAIVQTPITVKKGNAFERRLLSLFRFKTEEVVLANECHENPTPSAVKISGAAVEVWVYGEVCSIDYTSYAVN